MQLASLQAEAVSLRSRARTLDENLRAMVTRPAEARLELADLRSQLDNVQTTIVANASPLLAEASRLRVDATREELSARIEKTEQELLTLPTRESIAMAQRDLNTRKLKQTESHTASLRERMNAQRAAEAARQERDARDMFEQLSGHPDAVRELAAGTPRLRASLLQVTYKLDTAQSSQKGLRMQLEAVEEARRTAEQILEIGPIGAENGRLLRGLGRDLQSPAAIAQRIAQRATRGQHR